jgi:hypothetical protein
MRFIISASRRSKDIGSLSSTHSVVEMKKDGGGGDHDHDDDKERRSTRPTILLNSSGYSSKISNTWVVAVLVRER